MKEPFFIMQDKMTRKNRRYLVAESNINWPFGEISCTSLCLLLLVISNIARVRSKSLDKKVKTTNRNGTFTPATTTNTSLTNTKDNWKLARAQTDTPRLPRSKRPTTKELSAAFDDVMKTYDKKFRPLYGEKATEVELSFIVLSFGHIREVEMEYEVDLYFLQVWNDLRFNVPSINHENATIELIGSDIEKIWVPDTIFINSKKSNFHHVTLENRFMTINLTTGEIVYHSRITMTGACNMDLRYYPFDEQTCYIAMESYGHDNLDIIYKWFTRGCNESCNDVYIHEKNLANFDITMAVKSMERTTYHTENFSSATGKFVFKRRTPYFILQIYLPCILIVMVSWASFWINEEAVPARAAICVTTILTIITMLGVVNVNMPKVSYVKAIDFYLFVSFIMVFLSLIEYILVLNIDSICKRKRRSKRDRMDNNKSKKKHSVVLMVGQDDYQNGDYASYSNGFKDDTNHDVTRQRLHKNGRRPSLFTFKVNSKKYKKDPDAVMGKERQQLLLEELLRLKKPSTVDLVSRFLFPLIFMLFNLCYWLIYLDQDKKN
eukprot:gene6035-6736_t